MGAALPFQSDCCNPCDSPTVQNTPGATGAAGADGADGADGVNAHTTTTADFTMPAKAATVAGVKVNSSAWMSVGQILYIENCGWMRVDTITDTNTITLENLETAGGAYAENVEPTVTVPSGSTVSCGGLQGTSGEVTYATSGDIELDGGSLPRLEITSAKGDLIINNNNAVAPRNTRLPVGGTGTFLRGNAAVGALVEWAKIDLAVAANFSNALPVAQGGGGAATKTGSFDNLSPLTTKGDVIARDASNNVRLAVGGTDGMLLQVDSAEATGLKYALLGPESFGADAEEVTTETIILRDIQASGTDGNTSSPNPGQWAPRKLTEISVDTLGTAILNVHTAVGVSGNKFTLSQGYYRITAYGVGYQIGYHQIRLWNVTNGEVQPYVGSGNLIYGTTEKSPAGSDMPTKSVLEGRFQVSGATEELTIEHYAQLANIVAAYGKAASIPSVSEVYTVIRLEKIAKT